MATPGATNRVVNDLVPGVIEALQQRTDVATFVPKYIKKAIIEITESQAFEELRRTGPKVTLTAGQPIYAVSQFLASGDDYSSPEVMVIYVDTPTNTVVDVVQYKTPQAIERMIAPATKGLPSRFTRYGTNFHFGPTPDKGYTTFLRYQVRHPFPTDVNALGGAPLFIPDTWEEIVEYAAALRLAVVKRWNDQAKILHDLLYGDPEFQSTQGLRGRPGLIAARTLQNERDAKFNSRQLGIRTARINAR